MTRPNLTPGDLKRRDVLIRLASACAGGVGLSYAAQTFKRGGRPGEQKSGKVFANLGKEASKIARISLISRSSQFDLVKAEAGWVLPQADFYPVADDALSRFIKALTDLRYVRTLPPPTKLDTQASQIAPLQGADGVFISLETKDKAQIAILTLARRGDMTLAQLPGEEALYEISTVDWPPLDSPKAWLDLPRFDISPERIATVELIRPDQDRLDIVRRPDGGFAPVGGTPSPRVTDIVLILGRLEPQAVMAANRLRGAPAFSHSTSLKSGLIIALDGFESAGQFWVKVRTDTSKAASPEEGERWATQTKGWAYAIPPNFWTLLMTPTPSLLQASP
ncbi:hypothetical protein MCEMIH15_01391 [Caulobacteraceae bacterium]